MLKVIVAAAVVVVITSTSGVAGIVLTQAAFARASTMNSGTLADESQSFRMVAKAPRDLRLVRPSVGPIKFPYPV
jgi:hypothetical protein